MIKAMWGLRTGANSESKHPLGYGHVTHITGCGTHAYIRNMWGEHITEAVRPLITGIICVKRTDHAFYAWRKVFRAPRRRCTSPCQRDNVGVHVCFVDRCLDREEIELPLA